MRSAEESCTCALRSRRATTSRTGRSPTLVTVPVTVTVGSLEVVTTSGVTLSRRTRTNSDGLGSAAAVGADGAGATCVKNSAASSARRAATRARR